MALQPDVKLLRWPAESQARLHCSRAGVLRLLIVEAGVAPPQACDDLEDWVRSPVRQDDVDTRIETLRFRYAAGKRPVVDPYGVVHCGGRAVSLSPTATDLMGRLCQDFGRLVARETLISDCLPEGSCVVKRNALDLHIMRLRRRIQPLDLAINTIWGRGYLLDHTRY